MPTIGVFDSGIGGEAIAQAIRTAIPDTTVITKSDTDHMPYGDKTPAQVLGFVVPLLQELVDAKCELIVIACNTVTTHHITTLRQKISVPLVGIEPMIKPAAQQTNTGVIAVCATPATLASPRYAELKQLYAKNVTILEPDCSKWAYMIEHNTVNDELIRRQIDVLCKADADVIVLGCTHYHWIDQKIQAMAADRAVVLQPEAAVIRQIQRILE